MAHGLSHSRAHGILPDQGSNLCLLHWQANSLPLSPQGSPLARFFEVFLPSTCILGFTSLGFNLHWDLKGRKAHHPVSQGRGTRKQGKDPLVETDLSCLMKSKMGPIWLWGEAGDMDGADPG